MSLIEGYQKWYLSFQFMFAAYYTWFSICWTDDIILFEKILKNHMFDKLLHLCIVIFIWIPYGILFLLSVISGNNDKNEIKQQANDQIRKYDDDPIEIRAIFLPGIIVLILCFVIPFDIIPDTVISFIHECLNTVISIVGLICVMNNVKKSKDNE